jgi:hypothetical protein
MLCPVGKLLIVPRSIRISVAVDVDADVAIVRAFVMSCIRIVKEFDAELAAAVTVI